MDPSRRQMLRASGMTAIAAASGTAATVGSVHAQTIGATGPNPSNFDFAIAANTASDVTEALQDAITQVARLGQALILAPGSYRCRTLSLPDGTIILGTPGATRLVHIGSGALMRAAGPAGRIQLSGLTLHGAARPAGSGTNPGLLEAHGVGNLSLSDLTVRSSNGHGLSLERCSGRITGCQIHDIGQAAIFSLDGQGLMIDGCQIRLCANNGIQIWQSQPRTDGAIITNNRIFDIRSDAGGTGQNGNGVNVFRAGDVTVQANAISNCAYSAVRGNSASNIQIVGNQAHRIGEVALYAEFAFQGAVIANNVIDGAATGVSVTNFNEGGRLAVVQGNLIRNLQRREFEPIDQRGNGISVEADTAITGNVIENAPTSGIWIGNGAYMRDVTATGNVVRGCGVGIAISGHSQAGAALVSGNMITGARNGNVRLSDGGSFTGADLGKPGEGGRVKVSGNHVA